MHDTALSLGKLFFDTYAGGMLAPRILDVGSMDVNGSLRDVAPPDAVYLGLDIEVGPGVDVVCKQEIFPFRDGDFDIAVSTSCFEHDVMFWVTVGEMLRVIRPGGLVYINAPSNGIYHAHPLDCWRFYADAGLALARWCTDYCDIPTMLVESFTARRGVSGWNDAVIVLGKGAPWPALPERFMSDETPSYNARKNGSLSGLIRPQTESEDQQLIAYLAKNAGELLGEWLATDGQHDRTRTEGLAERTTTFLKTFGLTR